jgi:hypothetical protein
MGKVLNFNQFRDPKMNWKYILIVMFLAFLMGGGILLCWRIGREEIKIQEIKITEKPKEEKETKVSTKEELKCQTIVKGDADIPPLPVDVTWQGPQMVNEYQVEVFYPDKYEFETKKLPGCIIRATEISFGKASEIRNRYFKELSERGWILNNAADSPLGFVNIYQKNNLYLMIEGSTSERSIQSAWTLEIFLSE